MKISPAGFVPACLLVWFACVNARAAETLTLGRAIERATAESPLLAARSFERDAVAARAARESMPPPLTLGADLENVAGNGALSGTDSAETTLRIGRVFELGGKRAARQALGGAEVAQAAHGSSAVRLDVVGLTTLRFVEVAADQERLDLAAERVALAESTRAEVARAVESARNPETDLRAAEIALDDAELEREHAEHELASARVTLASTWGATEASFDRVSMALHELPTAAALETLVARLPDSSGLRAATLEQDLLAARQQVAGSLDKPDLTLSVGVRRLEAFGDHGLVLSASMPLGSAPRARLARAESRAHLDAAIRHREALRADLHQELFEKYQELAHARTESSALRESMLPKARRSLELAQRGFAAGRFPFITLSQSQQTVFDLRRREIDAAARYHFLLAEIDRLTTTTGAP